MIIMELYKPTTRDAMPRTFFLSMERMYAFVGIACILSSSRLSLILLYRGFIMVNERVNNVAFIVYPDSQDIDKVIQYLSSRAYRAAISPLHTPDDESKKPHFHVLVTLSSPRELNSLNKEFNAAFVKTEAFKVSSSKGYARYLCHLDSPEKQQFPIGVEPRCINGFPWASYAARKVEIAEQGTVVKAILEKRFQFDIHHIGELILLFEEEGLSEYVAWICSHSYLVCQLLR